MPSIVPLDNTLGAFFTGMVVSAVLFGTTSLQVFMFYRRYPNDTVFTKLMVAILWLLDALVLVFCAHALYYHLISNYGNFLALLNPAWSIKAENLLTDVMIPLIQSMYCFRVWKLAGKDKLIPAIATVAVVAAWGTALTNGILSYRETHLAVQQRFRLATSIPLATAAAVDIILACIMFHYVRRGKEHFENMGSVLNRIILAIFATGMLTSIAATATLITFILMPNNLVFLGVQVVLGKLYLNSFLAMLNMRKGLRKRHRQLQGTQSISLTTFSKSPYSPSGSQGTELVSALASPTGVLSDKFGSEVYANDSPVTEADARPFGFPYAV